MAKTTADKQIRARERVRDLGEVFTAEREVNAMLDLLPAHILADPLAKFLEPACGNGAFLEPILRRKLASLEQRLGTTTQHATQFGVLLTLASIYAVDISDVNVTDSRARLQAIIAEAVPAGSETFWSHVDAILASNIVQWDFLQLHDVRLVDWQAPYPGLIVGVPYTGAGTRAEGPVTELEFWADPEHAKQ